MFYRARTFMTLELCTSMAARCATQLALGPSGGPGRSLASTIRPNWGAGAGLGGGRGADSVGFGAEIGLFLPFLANDAGAVAGGGGPWVVLAAVSSRLASVMDSYEVRRPVGHSPVCCDAAIGGGAEDGSGHDSRDGGWLKLSSTHDHRAALCV